MPESEDSTNGLYHHTTEFDFENQHETRALRSALTLVPHQLGGERIETVNARDLHSFLEAGKDFSTWFRDRIEQYRFTENIDFCLVDDRSPKSGSKGRGGHNRKEYALTLDMAKELSMVERNERGRQARRYFIECEREVIAALQADQSFKPRQAAKLDVNREQRLTLQHHVRIARMAGLSGNQALLAANSVTAAMTGIDTLGMMGLSHLTAPRTEQLLTPTDIGRQMNPARSPQAVNQMLCGMGLQHAIRTAKGKIDYDLTDEGERAGGVMQDTGKRHSTGAPVRQVRWGSSIVQVLEDDGQRH